MDPMAFNPEMLRNMTHEERREAIHNILTLSKEKDSRVKTVLFDESSGGFVNLADLMEKGDIEQVTDFLLDLVENCECNAASIHRDDIHELLEKCKSGEATEDEQRLAAALVTSMSENELSNKYMTIKLCSEMMLDLVAFANARINHNRTTYKDVLDSYLTLVLGSMLNTPNGAMERFKSMEPSGVSAMMRSIGAEIKQALTNSIWKDSMPSHEFAILGLLTYLQEVMEDAEEKNEGAINFVDPKIISDFFGMNHDFSDIPIEENHDSEESNTVKPVCHCAECTCGNHDEKDC